MNGHNFKVGESCTVRVVKSEFGEKDYNGVVIHVDGQRNVIECVMPMIGLKCEFAHKTGDEWQTPFDDPNTAIIKPVEANGKDSKNSVTLTHA